jgi:hypothetical protein
MKLRRAVASFDGYRPLVDAARVADDQAVATTIR